MAFSFPQKFLFDGQEWRKVYDPQQDGPDKLPNMQIPHVQGVAGQWLQIPYSGKSVRIFCTVVDLLYPAISSSASVQAAQQVRGIRFFTAEVDPSTVPPTEMVMYIRDAPRKDTTLQAFVNTMLGVAVAEAGQAIDRNWADTVLDTALKEQANA